MWFTGNNVPGLVGRITLPPLVRDMAADTITTTSARLRGKVRANSQATEYSFEYGTTTAYGNETPEAYAGQRLRPERGERRGRRASSRGTKYHYRLVAENDAGETEGADRTFTTESLPASLDRADPCRARADARFRQDGRGRARGHASREGAGRRLGDDGAGRRDAVGATFDTRPGAVSLTSAGCRGNTQTGSFGGGLFTLRQPRKACGRVDVYLRGGRFAGCPRAGAKRRARGGVGRVPASRRAGCASSGAATAAAASARTGATARRRCAAPAG